LFEISDVVCALRLIRPQAGEDVKPDTQVWPRQRHPTDE